MTDIIILVARRDVEKAQCITGWVNDIRHEAEGTTTSDGFVYVFRSKWADDTWIYKIGRSINWENRLREINGQMPHPVEPWAVWPDSKAIANKRGWGSVEGVLHNWLKQYRLGGEWFDLPPNIVQSLRTYCGALFSPGLRVDPPHITTDDMQFLLKVMADEGEDAAKRLVYEPWSRFDKTA